MTDRPRRCAHAAPAGPTRTAPNARSTAPLAALFVVLSISLSISLAGCGVGEDAAEPSGEAASSATCAPLVGDPLPPEVLEVLDLGDLVVANEVIIEPDSINASGLADRPVAEVIEVVQGAIREGGWEFLSFDDEGFEAEILATNQAGDLLGVELSAAPCEDQTRVAISLLRE
ncbi:hypothetical protein [Nocardioides sp.]|uniref:hypothetical protein n=1 Tax=Nocardioides sp. TaxID=35761 RepID=UPI003562419B